MTEPTPEDLWWAELDAAVRPFFDNSKGVKPDVKALARLLRRSVGPLPRSTLFLLAELLDSEPDDDQARTKFTAADDAEIQFWQMRRCNWRLKPVYCGKSDRDAGETKKEKQITEAMAAGMNITNAIAAIDADGDGSGSTSWRTRRKMKKRQAWLKRWRADRLKARAD